MAGGQAIAHPDFGRIEGAAGKRRQRAHGIMYYLPTQIQEATYVPVIHQKYIEMLVKFIYSEKATNFCEM